MLKYRFQLTARTHRKMVKPLGGLRYGEPQKVKINLEISKT